MAYTGTHDNETLVGWLNSITAEDRALVREYLCDQKTPQKELHRALIALVLRSAARLCVIPMQDYMGLNNRSRTNKPSTVGTNWLWRLRKTDLTPELQRQILRAAVLYGRAERPQGKAASASADAEGQTHGPAGPAAERNGQNNGTITENEANT